MRALRDRRPRGQATVELALGTFLFLTLLMGGLHLVEVCFLSFKVQEASAAALWDATGQRVTDFSNPQSPGSIDAPYAAIPGSSAAFTTGKYKNFDGVLAGGMPQRLFTKGTGVKVTCRQSRPGSVTIPGGFSATGADAVLQNFYRDPGNQGGVECTASTSALPFGLDTNYGTTSEGFFFKQVLAATSIKLCGVGAAVGSNCTGHFGAMLGDWALDGNVNGPAHKLNQHYDIYDHNPGEMQVPQVFTAQDTCDPNNHSTANKAYCQMVRDVFLKSGAGYQAGKPSVVGAASKFAANMGGAGGNMMPFSVYPGKAPYEEQKFQMAYVGPEGDPQAYPSFKPLPTEPYMDEVRDYRPRCCNVAGAPPWQPWCETCHYNAAGTMVANGNPPPSPIGFDYDRRRRTCFLGLGGHGCKDLTPGRYGGPFNP